MKKYSKFLAIAGVAVAFLFALQSLVTAPRVEPMALAQSTTPETEEKMRKDYRDAVLKRMEMGERVSVPEDRITLLSGSVKLIEPDPPVRTETRKSVGRQQKYAAEIESVAARLADPALRDGLRKFARIATDQERAAFLNGGRFYIDNTAASPTPDAEKKCRDSCETITSILCKEVCNWDCRIVNGEKVCEKSCSTICPEITNIVCKKVCD